MKVNRQRGYSGWITIDPKIVLRFWINSSTNGERMGHLQDELQTIWTSEKYSFVQFKTQ